MTGKEGRGQGRTGKNWVPGEGWKEWEMIGKNGGEGNGRGRARAGVDRHGQACTGKDRGGQMRP